MSENRDEVRRKVFGVPSEVSESAYGLGGEREDGAERKYGVRARAPGLDSRVDETRGIAERKKDVIKKEYKRPGRIHTEEDRQPWVKGQPRAETPQQVYGGLRRQVSKPEGGLEGSRHSYDMEGGVEENLGLPSASRDLEWGQQVDFKVYQFTPLGMRVIIRGGYDGLVYGDQMDLYGRDRIEIGDVMKGWVFKIRDDDKVRNSVLIRRLDCREHVESFERIKKTGGRCSVVTGVCSVSQPNLAKFFDEGWCAKIPEFGLRKLGAIIMLPRKAPKHSAGLIRIYSLVGKFGYKSFEVAAPLIFQIGPSG